LDSGVEVIENAIGGVEARRIILRELLEGAKTGLELRFALARSFGVTMEEISDARLYFNLQQLEEAGIIVRKRDWRSKYAEILPHKIQAVRSYLGIKAPAMYIGGISENTEFIRTIKWILSERSRVQPSKYIFLTKESIKRKISGITGEIELMSLPDRIITSSFDGVYEAVKEIVDKHIRENEIILDLTEGEKFCSLALYALAREYGLKCFYVMDNERIIWIK